MNVRTKTTSDVANLLMTLKQGYRAHLIADGSLNITGLTGWPNPTSPRGWGPESRRRMELPFGTGDLSPVSSNSGAPSGTANLAGGGSGGAPGSPGGSSSMSGAPPSPGSPGGGAPSGGPGMPGAPGGGSGGAGAGASFQLSNVPLELQQMLVSPEDAAKRQYITPSDEPPPQPYLNLVINGAWAVTFSVPSAGGGAGGRPGMPGMSGPPPGAPGMSGPPPSPGMSGPPPVAGKTGS